MPLIITLKHFLPPRLLCHGCRRRAKQSPEVSIISLRPRGTGEITLYLLSHKVTVKVWRRAPGRLWRDAGDPEIPQTPHLSPPGYNQTAILTSETRFTVI